MIEKEEWKVYKDTRTDNPCNIRGCLWEVSNLGRVKKNGELYKCSKKYRYYKFSSNELVHRAVVESFIGHIPKGYQVDHIDGNRYNNRVDNLRICTPKENQNNPITLHRKSECKKGKSNGPFSETGRNNMSLAHLNKQRLYINEKAYILI